MRVIDVTRPYFLVRIGELLNARVESERPLCLILEWGEVGFRIRKVRVLGRIIGLHKGPRRADYIISDGSGEITLRVWEERMPLFKNIVVGDLIETFALPRIWAGTLYLVPVIVSKRREGALEGLDEKIRAIRGYLVSLEGGGRAEP